MDVPGIANTILQMERQALGRWAQGDPDGFLEISAPHVTYFDPFVDKRLDGLAALRSLYDELRGKIHIDRFELLAPLVQVAGEAAVLTFQFESTGSEGKLLWNTTKVYQNTAAGWRIVHTHWAFNRPGAAPAPPQPAAAAV